MDNQRRGLKQPAIGRAAMQAAGPLAGRTASPLRSLSQRLADIDRSLGVQPDPTPVSTSKVRVATERAEHPNVKAARDAIAQMVANEAAGTADETCVACAFVDQADAKSACGPVAVAAAAKALRAGPTAGATSGAPAKRATPSPRRKRPARAFGVGLAGGMTLAGFAGMFGTAFLIESSEVTAARHHAAPLSSNFAFQMAGSDAHDGGPAWAWREAVSMRTIRDLTEQRAGTGSTWSARAQLSPGQTLPAAHAPTTAQAVGSSTVMQAAVIQAAVVPVAVVALAPHHPISVESAAKLSQVPIRTRPVQQSDAASPPRPVAILMVNDAAPRGTRAAAPLANARSQPPVNGHHLLAQAAVPPPAKRAKATIGHHVLTQATEPPPRVPRAAAVPKKVIPIADDHDGDTASIEVPAKPKADANRVVRDKKPVLLSTAAPAEKSAVVAASPETKWWQKPMPAWAPFTR